MATDHNKRARQPGKIDVGTEPSVPGRGFVPVSLQSAPRGSVNERQAGKELDELNARWGSKYQAIGKLWKENWGQTSDRPNQ